MSPNEFQLRNALHDGEGATPDADRLIAHAAGVRRDRRRRLNTALASGAAVAVVGSLATVLVITGSGSESGASGGANMAGGGVAAPAASAATTSGNAGYGSVDRSRAGGPAPQASTASGASVTACPAEPERYMLPGGGGIGRYGSAEKLFDDSVTSLRLCGYPLRASAGRTTATLDGSAARSIVRSLNSAPTADTGSRPCPANINSASGTLQIIGLTADGRASTPVVLTIGCPTSKATNGTAVRYLNTVPETLKQMVIPIPLKSTAGGVPGKITISPVR